MSRDDILQALPGLVDVLQLLQTCTDGIYPSDDEGEPTEMEIS
jgi:hypothetical protein